MSPFDWLKSAGIASITKRSIASSRQHDSGEKQRKHVAMVLYFTSSEGHTIYMGKDKFENEDLIRYGFLEDIWFHVDDLSSAHVYLRLPVGASALDDISETCLEECAQLVKENSIEGSKKKSVKVVYTKWRNLKKTKAMEVGQVGFNHPERVRTYTVKEKDRDILKALNKTKIESYPDLEEERQKQELLYKSDRKKQRLQLEAQERKARDEYKKEKELRSYSTLMTRENIESGGRLQASADLSSVNAYEEDFMYVIVYINVTIDGRASAEQRMETRSSSTGAMQDATPEPQTPQATEEQIQQCLRMLEGKSDEHKFAGLLMITKLSGVDDERMRRVRRQVVDIVGVNFFLRLISTRGDGEDSVSSFQVLGLNLIASFCDDPSVAVLFAQEKLVRFALDHLALLPSPVTPSVQDCVSILQGIVQTEEGKSMLSHEKTIGRVVSTLRKMLRNPVSTSEDGAKSEMDTAADAVIANYWSIVEALSAHMPFWTALPSYDFEYLCSAFSHARGVVTVGILAIFNNLMQLIEEACAPAELLSSRALSDLRVGVVRFLRSKWTGHERDECLRLVYQLTRHSGFQWMLPGTILRSQETEDEVSGGKFVLFVLKLVGIEIKVMLDEVELALLQMEEKTVERVDEEERQVKEVQRAMAVLPVCYGLVEFVIAGLVSSADGASVLPYDILIKLKQSFSDTFTVVIEHLTAARDFMKTHRYKGLLANQSPIVFQLDAIVFASVRVISAWLAEDSDTGVEQAIDLLPFLVCYKPLHQHESPSSVIHQTSSALDSDDEEIDSDDEVDAVGAMLRTATRIQEDDEQIDQLHFLLPGLLQISAMPEGAQAIAEDVDVLRRILRFCCTLCATISTGEEQFGGLPTLTLSLGILLNLLLLRSSNVEVTTSGRAASALPNAVEWYRALSFLLPVACASGSHLATETTLTEEDRGEDDRYVMALHIACVILLIASNFQDKKTVRPCRRSPAVAKLVTPFNNALDWMVSHPPDASSESATDLLELCRGLMLRSPLTPQLLQ